LRLYCLITIFLEPDVQYIINKMMCFFKANERDINDERQKIQTLTVLPPLNIKLLLSMAEHYLYCIIDIVLAHSLVIKLEMTDSESHFIGNGYKHLVWIILQFSNFDNCMIKFHVTINNNLVQYWSFEPQENKVYPAKITLPRVFKMPP